MIKPIITCCLLLSAASCSLHSTPPEMKATPPADKSDNNWMPPEHEATKRDAGTDDGETATDVSDSKGMSQAGATAEAGEGGKGDDKAAGSGGAGHAAPPQPLAAGAAGTPNTMPVPPAVPQPAGGGTGGTGGAATAGAGGASGNSRTQLVDAIQANMELPRLFNEWRLMAASGEDLTPEFVTMLMKALAQSGTCLRGQRTCQQLCFQLALDCRECAADMACHDAVRNVCGEPVASCRGAGGGRD